MRLPALPKLDRIFPFFPFQNNYEMRADFVFILLLSRIVRLLHTS